jgi:hypothetical protein
LQVPDDNTGFDDQLADSRDWLDEMTLRNYRGGNVSLLGYHGFALDAWHTGGGRRTSLTNRWLFAALAANQLLVTPRVKVASSICRSGRSGRGKFLTARRGSWSAWRPPERPEPRRLPNVASL